MTEIGRGEEEEECQWFGMSGRISQEEEGKNRDSEMGEGVEVFNKSIIRRLWIYWMSNWVME